VRVLTTLIVVPLVAALLMVLLDRIGRGAQAWGVGLGAALAVLAMTVHAWISFDLQAPGFQFVERAAWLPAFGAHYHLAVDGISLVLVSLTACLTPMAFLMSRDSRGRPLVARDVAVLVIEAACIVAFTARDLLLFYVSAEAMLLPVFVLIGVWGGGRRVYAALRFLLFSLTASGLTLLAILWIGWRHQVATGIWTFAMQDLLALDLPAGTQSGAFLALVVACAIRMPVFPFHTWFSDALAQAPTAGGVMLAGCVVNVGGYGLVRFAFPLLPDAAATAAPWLAVIAAAGVLYGAVAAIGQDDLRRVVAYVTVSHMGLVMLGLSALTVDGMQGALFHLVAHGAWSAGLLMVTGMLAVRRHTTRMSDFGGLFVVVPGLSFAWLAMTLASIGIPGAPGLMGTVRSLAGAAGSTSLVHGPLLAAIAGAGMIVAGVCMLRAFWHVSLGPIRSDRNRGLRDVTAGESVVLVPLCVLVIAIGVWPSPLLAVVEPAALAALAGILGTTSAIGP
jgi:NADH-quinone oxidoreductase subunit M